MALHSLYCADVPLRNCSPPHVEVVQGKMWRWPIRCLVTKTAELFRDYLFRG